MADKLPEEELDEVTGGLGDDETDPENLEQNTDPSGTGTMPVEPVSDPAGGDPTVPMN